MRNNRFCLKIAYRLTVAISSLIITANTTHAQLVPPQPGPLPGATEKERAQDIQNREWRLRNMEREPAQAQLNPQRLREAVEIVKQDFKRIQVVRNELVGDLTANRPLNYKQIAERAGEINKRAHRLKTFLMPPVPEEKEQKNEVAYNHEEMKGALVKLCNTIFNFTENPVLKNPDVVDLQQSAKAGRDLLTIIEVSSNIKTSAEKLGKE